MHSKLLPRGTEKTELGSTSETRKILVASGPSPSDRRLARSPSSIPTEALQREIIDRLPNTFVYRLIREPNGDATCTFASSGVESLLGVTPSDLRRNPHL